jgi:2-polyprenyl-3-methyl-5-hydroxy-6-metoxy-1,4-benzoquinol methylase
MSLFNVFLSKNITAKVNRGIEMFLPPVLADRKVVACLFNYLQGRGFRYFDVTKDPAAYPRGKRDSDYTTAQKEAVLQLISGKSILDVGCGSGSYIKFLAKRAFKCVGIDPSCTPLEENNLKMLQGFVQDCDFQPQSFDTVISFKTLEHIPEARAELAKWRTLAKQRLILVLPRQRYRQYVYDGHVNFYPDEYQLRLQLGLSVNTVIRKVSGEWLIYEDL